jgi:hypothetical protein
MTIDRGGSITDFAEVSYSAIAVLPATIDNLSFCGIFQAYGTSQVI